MDIRKQEHLTPAQLLEALEYCNDTESGHGCVGCPNAVPGSEDRIGLCDCVFDTSDEVLYWLKQLVKMQGGEENA